MMMKIADEVLSKIVEWAEQEEPIRALILVGSRAQADPVDELADFDLSVFVETHAPYTQSDDWLSVIGKVWVYIPEKFTRRGETIPTRLVIFEGGIKVDFAFHSTHVLEELADSDELDSGYKIILDKDGKTENFKPASFVNPKRDRPTEKDFINLVREFWFEAWHVAKYLKRDELWMVKFRDWGTKELLLKMIEWREQARHGWDYDTRHTGKQMRAWADAATWESLHHAFARFDSDDGWNGLMATMNLFRRLAIETAETLGFEYPDEVDGHITGFILRLRAG